MTHYDLYFKSPRKARKWEVELIRERSSDLHEISTEDLKSLL